MLGRVVLWKLMHCGFGLWYPEDVLLGKDYADAFPASSFRPGRDPDVAA